MLIPGDVRYRVRISTSIGFSALSLFLIDHPSAIPSKTFARGNGAATRCYSTSSRDTEGVSCSGVHVYVNNFALYRYMKECALGKCVSFARLIMGERRERDSGHSAYGIEGVLVIFGLLFTTTFFLHTPCTTCATDNQTELYFYLHNVIMSDGRLKKKKGGVISLHKQAHDVIESEGKSFKRWKINVYGKDTRVRKVYLRNT